MSAVRRRDLVVGGGAAAMLAGCAVAPQQPGTQSLRIGVASCADQSKPQPIWDAALQERCGFFVFAGDNVYGDAVPFDLARLRQAYAELESKDNFQRLRLTTPHLAVWDDHDYGLNDGGVDFAHKQTSKDEFLRFWRVPASDPRRTRPGLYHAQTIEHQGRRVQLIGLDTRWFRSPLKVTDQRGAAGRERYLADADPAKTLLGAEQWAWLEARLRERADVRVLVSSVQCVVDGHGWERWGNLPLERERLYRLLRTTGARGVVVVSGDRHIGGLYREANAALAYPLYEMTSSGVTHPWAQAAEAGPNRIAPLVTSMHYGVIDIDVAARAITLALRGLDNRVLQQQRIGFEELQIA
jgi:alkaline phosphatase D